MIGGPYDPPEFRDWDADLDGCPECGGPLWEPSKVHGYPWMYECLYCGEVFDIDGIPQKAHDLEPADELEQ